MSKLVLKTRRPLVSLLAMICVAALVATTASAQTVQSTEKSLQVGSNIHFGTSYCESSSSGIRALSGARTLNSVAIYDVGTRPRLYTSAGSIIETTGYAYNYSAGTVNMLNVGGTHSTSGDYYYSWGQGQYWNYSTSQYVSWDYNVTRNIWAPEGAKSYAVPADEFQTLRSSNKDMHLYSVNKNGQTYGSELLAYSSEYVPDLIAAVGIDGTEGYISRDEEHSVTNLSREEVSSGKTIGDTYISLYAEDGETVIGQFLISAANGIEGTAVSQYLESHNIK